MDDYIAAILKLLIMIAILVLIAAFFPGWFNGINSHEIQVVGNNTTVVFH